jgi:hypothetical protein
MFSFYVILLNAQPIVLRQAKVELALGITSLGGFMPPPGSFSVVLLNGASFVIHHAKVILSICVPALGLFDECGNLSGNRTR